MSRCRMNMHADGSVSKAVTGYEVARALAAASGLSSCNLLLSIAFCGAIPRHDISKPAAEALQACMVLGRAFADII